MLDVTEEMLAYNRISEGYLDAYNAKDYAEMVRICEKVSNYLKTIPGDTAMYRNGHKWTRARELLEHNERRIVTFSRLAGGRHW